MAHTPKNSSILSASDKKDLFLRLEIYLSNTFKVDKLSLFLFEEVNTLKPKQILHVQQELIITMELEHRHFLETDGDLKSNETTCGMLRYHTTNCNAFIFAYLPEQFRERYVTSSRKQNK